MRSIHRLEAGVPVRDAPQSPGETPVLYERRRYGMAESCCSRMPAQRDADGSRITV